MKKKLLLAVVIAIAAFSCKKEENPSPIPNQTKLLDGGDKKDVGGWDLSESDSLIDGGDKKDVGGWD
jgi:hypothetical protein